MESSAVRLTRILAAFCLTMVAAISIAILDERGSWSDSVTWGFPVSLAVASFLLIVLLGAGKDRPHGSWPSDKWVSREGEHEMRLRLEGEMEEASMHSLGTNWAKMEMEHLESKHSEE